MHQVVLPLFIVIVCLFDFGDFLFDFFEWSQLKVGNFIVSLRISGRGYKKLQVDLIDDIVSVKRLWKVDV